MRSLSLFNNLSRSPFRLLDMTDPFDQDFFSNGLQALRNEVESNRFTTEMKFDADKSAWDMTLELAGVSKDSLKIDAKEGHLILTGEKTRGVSPGKFEQTFKLPQGINYDKIEAAFEDGVLSLTFPLAEKKSMKTIQFGTQKQ